LEFEVSKTSKLKSEVFGTFWNHSEIEILSLNGFSDSAIKTRAVHFDLEEMSPPHHHYHLYPINYM
jgi:hypothetical protein